MKARTLFRVLLVLLVVFFAVLAMRSIMRPERFKTVYTLRHDEIVNRLTSIRTIQTVYKTRKRDSPVLLTNLSILLRTVLS